MPGRGKRGNGRGRGRGGAGARGRGRGRINIGGGGRGRNRELMPSAIGYVYRPRSNVDEFNDDFRIYGQFSSDEDDSETDARQFVPHAKKLNGRQQQKKNNLGFIKESRPSFGSNYDDHYDDAMDRAGLGASSSGQQHAAVSSNQQFAKGKSKYLKTVLFTKSSSSVDLTKEIEDVVVEQKTTISEQQIVQESISNLSLEDAAVDEKLLAKKELWGMLKGKSPVNDVAVETIDYADLTTTVSDIHSQDKLDEVDSSDQEESAAHINSSSEDEEGAQVDQDTSDDEIDQGTSSDEQDFLQNLSSEDEDDDELNDTEEDELLEDDMLIMEDYMEHVELEDGEDLNELLAWSAMQEGNLEVDLDDDDDDLYDYATLDHPSTREIPIMEEEEAKFTSKKGKYAVDEDTRKKVGHRTRDDNAVVDPEIFGQTLKAALADVPPGLRPGMRRWYEKQQRKEDRKKKKEEAKAHKREKKKNGKGKAKDVEDEDLTNQMAKIDERIRDFVQDDSISSFQFAPMATNVRRQLHVLAAAYNLKSKSTGGGGTRCTIVTKTPTTYIPNDRRYISRFLSDIQTNMDEQNRIIEVCQQ
ncbi:hypothetical protein G6F42_012105 [Rhizopus arrhizus]|nr:hypothetical protein G6F42_012105 [Rhizopus arrhizus]